MPNPVGWPVWYELLSNDADASQAFYEDVIGWTVHAAAPDGTGGMDYRMIDAGNHDHAGGLMNLTAEMKAGGARPTWLYYLGTDDVDATVARVEAHGGGVLMPAFDLPDVGRMAFVHDPQGIPFYVMTGSSDQDSTAYQRTGMGKCNWNELATPDHAAANAFYAAVFGWTYPDRMTMPGDLGDYTFVAVGDERIGATMRSNADNPAGWLFYFRVPDIDAAAARVRAGGGAVVQGPMAVPAGDLVLVATDPHGVRFGLAAPGKGE